MGLLHAAVDAALELRSKVNVSEIKRIDIDMPEAAYAHGGWEAERPLEAIGAQMNVAYAVATDFLLVPVALALFSALKGVCRDVMLVASALVLIFVVLDLALTGTNYASLITLSGQYASATDAAQRATYIAAASYPTSVLASRVEAVYSIGVPSVGILLIGFVMLSGRFGRVPAYLALAAGAFGIVAVSGCSPVVIVISTVTPIWILLVGYRLLRLGGQNSE